MSELVTGTESPALRERARRAYERGRLRAAVPWALWPLAVGAVAVLMRTCPTWLGVSAASVVAALVVRLLVRGGALARAAKLGLAVGTAAFGLAWASVELSCADGCAVDSWTTRLLCGSAGLALGVVIGAHRRHAGATIVGVAALAAVFGALGCATAGGGAVIGLAVALLAGAATSRWVVRPA